MKETLLLLVIAVSVLFMYARGTSQETLLYFIIGVLALLMLQLGRLGRQLEGVHDSLRRFLAQPVDARQHELKEELAAKKTAAKRRDRNELTIVLVIVAALALAWQYFSGGQSWRTFFQ